METRKIAIVMDGGLIQAIVAKELMPDIEIVVVDYDTEGAEENDIIMVTQSNGTEAEAYCTLQGVAEASIDIETTIQRIKERDQS